jgi:hypothetical protein
LAALSFGAEMAGGRILIIHFHQMPMLKKCGAMLPFAYINSWLRQAIILLIFNEKNAY